jgi:hypothetical protein
MSQTTFSVDLPPPYHPQFSEMKCGICQRRDYPLSVDFMHIVKRPRNTTREAPRHVIPLLAPLPKQQQRLAKKIFSVKDEVSPSCDGWEIITYLKVSRVQVPAPRHVHTRLICRLCVLCTEGISKHVDCAGCVQKGSLNTSPVRVVYGRDL